MDAFYERLIVRAATIDERLSDDFEVLPGQKGDADLAARRLAAWCMSSASGDWSLFGQRLKRDGWTIDAVLERLATVRRKTAAPAPAWADDAVWVEAALQCSKEDTGQIADESEPYAFEDLFRPLAAQAEEHLWSGLDRQAADNLTAPARASLRRSLLMELCNLCAPVLYERFVAVRNVAKATPDVATKPAHGTALYDQFVADMKAKEFRHLFEERPVLLRLIAVVTRQWIETSREFAQRLAADLPTIHRDILSSKTVGAVAQIDSDLSDPH